MNAIYWIIDGLRTLVIVPSSPRRLPRVRKVRTTEQALRSDAEAIGSDWQKVGDDLRRAMAAGGRETDGWYNRP